MKAKRTWTVINGFQMVSFGSRKEAVKYCYGEGISPDNIFLDER